MIHSVCVCVYALCQLVAVCTLKASSKYPSWFMSMACTCSPRVKISAWFWFSGLPAQHNERGGRSGHSRLESKAGVVLCLNVCALWWLRYGVYMALSAPFSSVLSLSVYVPLHVPSPRMGLPGSLTR